MAVLADLLLRDPPGLGQQRIVLEPTLQRPRFNPERGLKVAQIKFDVPAAAVQHLEGVLGDRFRAEEGRDHDLTARLKFTHGQGVRGLIIVLLAHPVRTLGLAQDDQVVTHPKRFAQTKVRTAFAGAVLLKHPIDAARP